MWTKDWPIPGQVVEIVHNDGNKQINDLKKKKKTTLAFRFLAVAILYYAKIRAITEYKSIIKST